MLHCQCHGYQSFPYQNLGRWKPLKKNLSPRPQDLLSNTMFLNSVLFIKINYQRVNFTFSFSSNIKTLLKADG